MIMLLDFRIYTFLAVCRHMNLTRAAEELCITQPTVTQHIQYLEDQYGTKLFNYRARKLTLTDSGRELQRAAMSFVSDESLLESKIRSGGRKSLTLGASLTIGEYVIGKKLSRLTDAHPDWNIKLTVGNTRTLLQMIDKGEIEFALVEGFFPRDEYDALAFDAVPFIAVCGAGSPLAHQKLRLADLLKERLLVRESGSGTREVLERRLSEENLSVADFGSRIEINNLSILKQLAAEGRGVTFLYQTAVEEELRLGRLAQVQLEDFTVEHPFTFVWRLGSVYRAEYLTLFQEFNDENEPSGRGEKEQ